jgi:hypothetical protein
MRYKPDNGQYLFVLKNFPQNRHDLPACDIFQLANKIWTTSNLQWFVHWLFWIHWRETQTKQWSSDASEDNDK